MHEKALLRVANQGIFYARKFVLGEITTKANLILARAQVPQLGLRT